jgi:hypothetical protein
VIIVINIKPISINRKVRFIFELFLGIMSRYIMAIGVNKIKIITIRKRFSPISLALFMAEDKNMVNIRIIDINTTELVNGLSTNQVTKSEDKINMIAGSNRPRRRYSLRFNLP